MKMISRLAVLAAFGCVGMHSAAAETPSSRPNSVAASLSNATTDNSAARAATAMPNSNPEVAKLSAMPNNAAKRRRRQKRCAIERGGLKSRRCGAKTAEQCCGGPKIAEQRCPECQLGGPKPA